MLRITLYKNCILNETYQNVISTGLKGDKSVLERYLETCNPHTIDDIDETYYKNSGILNFDLELVNNINIYEYNYMKILYFDEEGSEKLLRYCFIQDIKVNNELVQLYYSEDIFSSYADKIKVITESYLSRSRRLRYANKNILLHTLPINYDGNNKIELLNGTKDTYVCLVNIQYYSSSVFGNSTERNFKTFLIGTLTSTEITKGGVTRTEYNVNCFYNKENIINDLIDIISTQSRSAEFRKEWGGNPYYYQVGDIYIVPSGMININWCESFFMKDEYDNDVPKWRIITHPSANQIGLAPIKNENINKLLSNYNESFSNNFKRLSIGTFNNQVPVINNGTEIELKIECLFDNNNVKFILNMENQLIDITNDFLFEIPFTEINGEVNALHKMNRILGNVSSVFDLAVGITTGGVGVANNITKIEGLNKQISRIGKRTSNGIMASNSQLDKINSIDEIIDKTKLIGLGEFAFGGLKAVKGITALIENNAPFYTTNKGTFVKTSGFINAHYGIFTITIDSDNDDFVLKTINNTGYVVYEYCNDLNMIDFNNANSFVTENINYDIIKFDTINIIGSFPRTIALQLNEIFENGFKIWYNENLQDDNLGVR